jgi:ketosteroid isomerase-like protein
MIQNTIDAWHKIIEARDAVGLDNILAENVVFHSPVVHTPQEGKEITKLYLIAALYVFNNGSFKYLREVISGNNAFLEFSTVIEGIAVNGVDMITWGDDGRITDFKVMIRPLKAINLIHRMMGEMLQKVKPA